MLKTVRIGLASSGPGWIGRCCIWESLESTP